MERCRMRGCARSWVGAGWSLIERLVWSVPVVVVDVVDYDAFELLAVPDDGSVEELPAD